MTIFYSVVAVPVYVCITLTESSYYQSYTEFGIYRLVLVGHLCVDAIEAAGNATTIAFKTR